jgi:hypothetical protein
MTYARQRNDLKDLLIPTESGVYIQVKNWVQSKQPDMRDNDEFNTLIRVGHKTYWVASIDLEFKDRA